MLFSGTRCFHVCCSLNSTKSLIDFTADANGFINSAILNAAQDVALVKLLNHEKWSLCFSGNIHGWVGTTFHANCDNKGATVSIMQSNTNNMIFGGYMDYAWGSRNTYITSNAAFLFMFVCRGFCFGLFCYNALNFHIIF